jgi:ornithine--oxo-acid transaminase
MESQDYIDLDLRFGAHNYHPLPVVIATAKPAACRILKADILRLSLRLLGGKPGTPPSAYRRRRVEQLHRVSLTSRAFHNDKMGAFLRPSRAHRVPGALPRIPAPKPSRQRSRLPGLGSGGKEGAQRQAKILCAENNFHGRTLAAISMSSDPIPSAIRSLRTRLRKAALRDAKAVEKAVDNDTVAVMVEPYRAKPASSCPMRDTWPNLGRSAVPGTSF